MNSSDTPQLAAIGYFIGKKELDKIGGVCFFPIDEWREVITGEMRTPDMGLLARQGLAPISDRPSLESIRVLDIMSNGIPKTYFRRIR